MPEATSHRLIHADARDLSFLEDESVHLAITSPPYWNLKRYNEHPDQLGHIQEYETFLTGLEKVWKHVFRVLVPGGRLVGTSIYSLFRNNNVESVSYFRHLQ